MRSCAAAQRVPRRRGLQGGQVARSPRACRCSGRATSPMSNKIHCPATGNTWGPEVLHRNRWEGVPTPGSISGNRRPPGAGEAAFHRRLPLPGAWRSLPRRAFPRAQDALDRRADAQTNSSRSTPTRPVNLQDAAGPLVKLAARLRQSRDRPRRLAARQCNPVPTSGGSLALGSSNSTELGARPVAAAALARWGFGLSTSGADSLAFTTPRWTASRICDLHAIRALMVGGSNLWQQFTRARICSSADSDFRRPESSKVFHALWQIGDARSRPCGAADSGLPSAAEKAGAASGRRGADGQVLPLDVDDFATVEANLGE